MDRLLSPGRISPFGLLLAVWALVCQLAFGAAVADPAAGASLSALDAVSIPCTGQAPDPGAPAPHRHHAADVSLCPLHVALALPGLLPTAAPAFPLPTAILVFRAGERPPGRGPPPGTARVGAPRAPPFIA